MNENLQIKKSYKLIEGIQIIRRWISRKSKKNILKLTFLSIFIGVLEVTSLNSIGPIINLFDSRNNIELPFLAQFDKDQTIFFSTLIFALCITIISFIKIKTIRYSNFLSAEIGQEIAVKLFGNYLGHDLLIHKARESTKILNAFI